MRTSRTITTALALLLFASIAHAQSSSPNPDEQKLLEIANKARGERGTAPLVWDPALAQAARIHAERMQKEGGKGEHQYPGESALTERAAAAGARFSTISENVAGADTRVETIANAWIKSAVHSANILNPHHDHIGIAVLRDHGTLYAVEDFSKSVANLDRNDAEQQAIAALKAKGIQPATIEGAHADARLACSSQTGFTTHPVLIMQWDGADLNQLPEALRKQSPQILENAAAHTAAVASCPKASQTDANGQPFTTFKIAVLLY